MGAVGMLWRGEVRRSWRSVLLLTVLVGVVGSVALAGAAGARRSSTALERFEAASLKADAEMNVGEPTPEQIKAFRTSRGVVAVAELRQLVMFADGADALALAGAVDTRLGTVVDRARVIRGRHADPDAPLEIELGERLADDLGVDVGDHLEFDSITPEQVAAETYEGAPGPTVKLRIVGIVRRPLDLGLRGASGGVAVLTPAFVREYSDRIGSFGSILRVRATHGDADLPRVVHAARRIFGQGNVEVSSLGIETEGARNAIGVLTVAIWVFAAVFALAGIVTVGIVLGRQIAVRAVDQPTLRALGLTRVLRGLSAGWSALPIAFGGAALAVVGAALLSTRFPIGLARRAEPDPGFDVDASVLIGGGLAVIAFVLVIATIAALRVTRRAGADSEPVTVDASRTARAAAHLGLSPTLTTGVRMALEPGRGTTAVPVRSALVGASGAVLGIVAALVFAASLDSLLASPSAQGQTWDVEMFDEAVGEDVPEGCAAVKTRLAAASVLEALAVACQSNVQFDGRPTFVMGFAPIKGRIGLTMVEGREPRAADEVALGTSTLDAIGKVVGDSVRVTGPERVLTYRVVGAVAIPSFGEPQPLSDGGVFTGAGANRVDANGGGASFVGRFAPGVDPAAGVRRLEEIPEVSAERTSGVPLEIDRLRQVDDLPWILAVFLSFLAVVAVGHALVTAVRQRRRELAILKTLGFGQRQVRATIAWQATTLSVVGLVVGIPLGVIVGRFIWELIADDLGVPPGVTVPAIALVVVAVAAVLLANVVASLPARAAARTRPALVLRSE